MEIYTFNELNKITYDVNTSEVTIPKELFEKATTEEAKEELAQAILWKIEKEVLKTMYKL